MAKIPVAGAVKTRLAASLGPDAAAALARAFLQDTVTNLEQDGRELVLALDVPELQDTLGFLRPVLAQGEGDLGQRLARVLRAALKTHPWAIAFAADSPTLPRAHRSQAVDWLSEPGGPDAVIGPTHDGGYYALGVRRLPAGSLRGIRWSTAHACGDTVNALRGCGMTVRALEPWYDVDELTDLHKLGQELRDAPARASRTASVLQRLAHLMSA
jgi:hypothetical protein